MEPATGTKCTDRQKELVEKIFSVHETLRKQYRKAGEEEEWEDIWENHKQNSEQLQEYSKAMFELATEVWEPRNAVEEEKTQQVCTKNLKCRIDWVYYKCREYFSRDSDLGSSGDKLKLLDVGSCYNPFQKFSQIFDITAIDLCPVPGSEGKVYICDFLEVEVSTELRLSECAKQVLTLPKSHFNAVVFSFFLEYLPDPKQRLESCKKAADLLNTGGFLFVIRPDSSMTEANVRLMKEMKVGLALCGLKRIDCEKLTHMWCTSFIKLSEDELRAFKLSRRFINDVKKVNYNHHHELFGIPQDFKSIKEDDIVEGKRESFDPTLLEALPFH